MVFGEGNPNAIVMFVGEGPGKEEQETGRPFVGRCGKLLRDMIRAIEIPEEHHYIANVVKDRPPGNRPPENEEIEACSKFLKKQIEIINPKVLVLLGRTAVKALMPNEANTPIGTLRTFKGHLVYTQPVTETNHFYASVIVTYHPSALLRTPYRKTDAKEDFLFIQKAYREFL
jgi:DNA polymerase